MLQPNKKDSRPLAAQIGLVLHMRSDPRRYHTRNIRSYTHRFLETLRLGVGYIVINSNYI